jgi:hypothetical protein|tara:strand:- start:1474 stop:2139 length:666 start_codon:yes stop_codon:yes gene_type:complete
VGETSTDTVVQILARLGRCLELIPIDPYGDEMSVGFYEKNGIITAWSFREGKEVSVRLEGIRNRIVALGDLAISKSNPHEFYFPGGIVYPRAFKFLARNAVEKSPLKPIPVGRIEVKDLKSNMVLFVTPREENGSWIYTVGGEGDAERPQLRIRSTVAGLVRYGEMEKVGDTELKFPCSTRYDQLVRSVMPYARNVSGTEDMLEADDSRGQMTTGTLGFSQ